MINYSGAAALSKKLDSERLSKIPYKSAYKLWVANTAKTITHH